VGVSRRSAWRFASQYRRVLPSELGTARLSGGEGEAVFLYRCTFDLVSKVSERYVGVKEIKETLKAADGYRWQSTGLYRAMLTVYAMRRRGGGFIYNQQVTEDYCTERGTVCAEVSEAKKGLAFPCIPSNIYTVMAPGCLPTFCHLCWTVNKTSSSSSSNPRQRVIACARVRAEGHEKGGGGGGSESVFEWLAHAARTGSHAAHTGTRTPLNLSMENMQMQSKGVVEIRRTPNDATLTNHFPESFPRISLRHGKKVEIFPCFFLNYNMES